MVISSSYTADMLGPTLRNCEAVSVGPFDRSRIDPKKSNAQMLKTYVQYKRLIVILSIMFLVRSIGLIAIKFLFARHLLGSSATNFLRALVSTISTRVIDRRRNKINAALEIYDNFPHKESSGRRLAGLMLLISSLLWGYILMRIAVDLAIFFTEPESFRTYVETELLMSIDSITPTAVPFIYLIAFIDIVLNRFVASAPMLNMIILYVSLNFVTNLKFRKFDEDILCCSSQEFVDPFVLRNLRLRHAELCDLVIYLDDIFSPLAIFWHGSVVAGYCSESINLIQKFSGGRGAGISLLSKMHFLLNFIYIITNLGLVTIATSLVCECKDRSEHVVRNMLFRPQAHRRAAAHQMRLLATQMAVENVQMTAFRFYSLNRSAFMTVMGAAVTYVSFVAQTAQKVTSEDE